MHTFTGNIDAVHLLPERDTDYYLKCLEIGYGTILQNLSNPNLNVNDVFLLEDILEQCDLVKSHWPQIEHFCQRMPRTLVHGDFIRKNMRVNNDQTGAKLFVFDWELAGRDIPAIDLAGNTFSNADINSYWSITQHLWPHLDFEDIKRMANVGTIFRSINSINWESLSLATEWIERPRTVMKYYLTSLVDSLTKLALED